MRVLIAGGGTGGHIYPGITLAQTLKKIDPSHEILFVGTERGLEADVVPRAGFPLQLLKLSGIPRRLSWKMVVAMVRAGRGMLETVKVIRSFKPDVVVGTGGYVCGPVVLSAALMGLPTVIHEQNAFPGITNRILGRFVRKVCLGYEAASRYFPSYKIHVTGNPIREAIGTVPRKEAAERLGVNPERPSMLVFGASQGARSINQAIMGCLAALGQEYPKLQILWITGQSNFEATQSLLVGMSESINKETLHVWPYLHNMPDAFAVSDWVVGRAGAISLAEITRQGLPAILVPYPHATGDHQTYNARVFGDAGAAWVVEDHTFNAEILLDYIRILMNDPSTRESMRSASLHLGRPSAAMDLANLVLSMKDKP